MFAFKIVETDRINASSRLRLNLNAKLFKMKSLWNI